MGLTPDNLSFAYVGDPSGRMKGIFFQKVPEPKVRGCIEGGGSFWTQMRDPEGNEFCVLRGPEDGWTPDEL